MGRYRIRARSEHCSGCRRCQLACSEARTGVFQPSAARIRIDLAVEVCTISLSEDCDGCGVCADACLYGALEKDRKEGGG